MLLTSTSDLDVMKEKDTRLSIRFSAEELEYLKDYANGLGGVTLSDFVRECLFRETGFKGQVNPHVSLVRKVEELERRLERMEKLEAKLQELEQVA